MRRKSINAAIAIAIAASMMMGTQTFAAEVSDSWSHYEEPQEKFICDSEYAWCIDENNTFVVYVTPTDYERFKEMKDLITLKTRGKERHFNMYFDDEAKQVTFKMRKGGLGRGVCYVVIGYNDDAFCFEVNIGGDPAINIGEDTSIRPKHEFDKDVNITKVWGRDLALDRHGKRLQGMVTTDDGKTYFAKENGEVCKNMTIQLGDDLYGFNENGVIRCNEFVKAWGKLYYYNDEGIRLVDTTFEIDGKTYHADKDGVIK